METQEYRTRNDAARNESTAMKYILLTLSANLVALTCIAVVGYLAQKAWDH
jgi:hypothetical protein